MAKRLLGIAAIAIAAFWINSLPPSDQYIYDRVVHIFPMRPDMEGHSCSGEQIVAPSGKTYILTAGHCIKFLEEQALVFTEDGNKFIVNVIAEDPESDLLLLEGIPHLQGLNIAKENFSRQHIRTFTHGHAFTAYKTEGVLIQNTDLTTPLFPIKDIESLGKCLAYPKFKAQRSFWGGICLLSVQETISTAFVVGGSSGGVVVDDSGNIVGVVSAVGEGFAFFVKLTDIQNFLKDY